MNRPYRSTAFMLVATLLPLAAQAHPGHESHAGLMQGLLHPLTGWDHLFVLLSLGVLAALRGVRMAAFCGGLMIAALLSGATSGLRYPLLPLVEPAILATVLSCVTLLLLRRFITVNALAALILAFTFVHGLAHGQEAPAGDAGAYFAGFTISAALLYSIGVLLALRLTQRAQPAVSCQKD
jgi:urease accessory protein